MSVSIRRDFLSFSATWIIRSLLILFSITFSSSPGNTQIDTVAIQADSARSSILLPEKKLRNRKLFIGGVHAVGYGGSLALLNQTWYKDFPRTSFHTFNDSREWLQMDKIGHSWAAYNAGLVSSAMWRWSGVSRKKAALIGGIGSSIYLTAVEFMDAYSEKWGWSWSDIVANISGSGLFISQELLWEEQRIQFKFSFHGKKYGEPVLNERANDLFGKSWYERMLKDYNAQTYWLSLNLKSFFKNAKLPAWLNVAVGYGADGMYGGFENIWTTDDPATINRTDIPRKRQFYLSPDIDFTKIPTNKKWVRTVFTFLNAFKCPAPALMMDSKGKMKAYVFYF